jgi:MFS family permease
MQIFYTSPFGFLGGMVSGMLLAIIYGFVPIYGQEIGLSTPEIGLLMGMIISGGLLLQIPFSRMGDAGYRTLAIHIACLATAIFSFTFLFSHHTESRIWLYANAGFLGGSAFTIYPLSMAYLCDQLPSNKIVEGTGGFVFSYGTGAVLGPIFTPIAIHYSGEHAGLFYLMILITTLYSSIGLTIRYFYPITYITRANAKKGPEDSEDLSKNVCLETPKTNYKETPRSPPPDSHAN